MNDAVVYKGKEWAVIDTRGRWDCDEEALGIGVRWDVLRPNRCYYAIRDDRLYWEALELRSETDPNPPIIATRALTLTSGLFTHRYEFLDMQADFCGRMSIGHGLLEALPAPSGTSYREVLDLQFNRGKILWVRDRSSEFAAQRQAIQRSEELNQQERHKRFPAPDHLLSFPTTSKFPGLEPPKTPNVLFSLRAVKRDPNEQESIVEIYFVNGSEESLELVESKLGGFFTDDDNVHSLIGSEYRYENVLPGEAVKVDQYDQVYDSDFVLTLSLRIKSKRFGVLSGVVSNKGSIDSTFLMQADGTSSILAKG